MRVKVISGMCGVALILLSGTARAQTSHVNGSGGLQTPPPKPTSFPILFPFPTNNNGYEELVRAADLIRNNPNVLALGTQPEMTLTLSLRGGSASSRRCSGIQEFLCLN